MDDVVIVAAGRTAVGKFGGSLAKIPASELGAHVIKGLLAQTGIDPAAFAAGITRADIKEKLKANTDEAIARGVFGSPTCFVGDDMYFGNDRLGRVRAAVLRDRTAAANTA